MTYQLWSIPGCTNCGDPNTETVDLYHGKRCVNCPPVFEPGHAVALMVDGWPHAAMAYVRSLP